MAAPAAGIRGGAALAPIAPARSEADPHQASVEDVRDPVLGAGHDHGAAGNMCRWPMGDPTTPEFRFCGGNAITGLPYCAHHSRIAYQPAADRRRERERRVAFRSSRSRPVLGVEHRVGERSRFATS